MLVSRCRHRLAGIVVGLRRVLRGCLWARPAVATHATGTGGDLLRSRAQLLAENAFLPDLSAIPEDVARRARLMWLNYPNNPTGATATLSFFEEAVAFCRRHDILLCHDGGGDRSQTYAALQTVIPALLARGYTFVAL